MSHTNEGGNAGIGVGNRLSIGSFGLGLLLSVASVDSLIRVRFWEGEADEMWVRVWVLILDLVQLCLRPGKSNLLAKENSRGSMKFKTENTIEIVY